MSRHLCTHPPTIAFGVNSSRRARHDAPFRDPTPRSLVPVANETVVGDGSPTAVRRAVAMPSTFPRIIDLEVVARRSSSPASLKCRSYSTVRHVYDYQVVCSGLLLKC